MKKVTKDDYVFDIDIERAEGFYSAAPTIFEGLSEYLPELTRFMASLGINIEKPVEYDPTDTHELLYQTFGTFAAETGYELDFYGEDKYVSVVISGNEANPTSSVHDGIINVAVFGIALK